MQNYQNQHNNRTGELMLTAAVGFVAGALLANPVRKLAVQGTEALMTDDWLDALVKEHRSVQKAMQKIVQTSERDAMRRHMLISKVDYALTKHSLEEEKVIYPAIRRFDEESAQRLFADHADIKTLLGELQFDIPKHDPIWIERARMLQTELEEHIREEEDTIFPILRERVTEDEHSALTRHMHMQGAAVA